MLAAEDDDLHRLAPLKILCALDAAVLALGYLAADRPAIVDLATIGAEIEPAFIGILRDDAVGGADEPRGVEFVMPRHWKLQHVDIIALNHIFKDRAVSHVAWRKRFQICHPFMVALDNVDLAPVLEREPARQRDPADLGEVTSHGSVPLRIACYFVKQNGGERPPPPFPSPARGGLH